MTGPSQRAGLFTPPRLLFLALAGLILSLLLGMLVPVYSDETGWRMQERAAVDGVDILFNDLCGPNTLARPPWYMMPARWFSAVTNGALASPLFIRAEGLLCALAFLVLVWLLICQLEGAAKPRRLLGMAAYGLLGLGTLPFILVLSRPEQPLILTTILILLAVFSRPPAETGAGGAALKIIAILGLAAVAQSYHLKGVLYAAVAFIGVAACAQGRKTLAVRLSGLTALVAMTVTSALYWIHRLQCPGDAKLAALYARENVAAGMLGKASPLAIAAHAVLGSDPLNYAVLARPASRNMSAWLPQGLFAPATTELFRLLLILAWGAALLAIVVPLVRHLVRTRWKAAAEPRFMMALALLGVAMVWGASQLNHNVYEAAHILPVLVMAMLCAMTLPTVSRERSTERLSRIGALAIPVLLVSQAVVLGALTPALAQIAGRPGYIPAQPFSVSNFGYASIRRDIRSAMEGAGIPTNRPLKRLMVDELTYMALQDSRLPLHRLGVLSVWNGSITDPVAYLLSRGSVGVVVGCHMLPTDMRAAATQSGPICALSKRTLEAVKAPSASKAT